MSMLDQTAVAQDIGWTQGDPVALTATVPGRAAWAGAHTVESTNATIATMAATVAVAAVTDALLTLTLPAVASALVPVGEYDWRLQAVGGPTRMAGTVIVRDGAGGSVGVNVIDATDVFDWLGTSTPTAEHLVQMQLVVDAVQAHVARFYDPPVLAPDADWRLGLIMQSARVWKRKDSPQGIIANDEFGVVRVSRLDADIAEMLAPFRQWGIA